jgi:hypothetical protein
MPPLRPGARIHAPPHAGVLLRLAGLAQGACLAQDDCQGTRPRAHSYGLVAPCSTRHTNAASQRPCVCGPANPLDGLEAQKRLHLRRNPALHAAPAAEHKGSVWARAGAQGLRDVLPSSWDVH